jgi:hypothetical protein
VGLRPRRITASWVGAPPEPPQRASSPRAAWSPPDDSGLLLPAEQHRPAADPRSTLGVVAAPGPSPTPRPPGRALLRAAGALTQLTCGACLLIGTIGVVLVEQHRTGGLVPVVGWLITALAGLVFGGLIYRGGLVSMLIAAAIDAGSGIVLVTLDLEGLRRLLQILRASDVDAIHAALGVAGFAMLGAAAICLIALPHGIRYARWFRDAAATRSAMSTARGFPPPPVPVRTGAYIIPAEERSGARRRLYMALGGVAIGVGAGFGVLVSSTRNAAPPARAVAAPAARPIVEPGPGRGAAPASASGPAAKVQPAAVGGTVKLEPVDSPAGASAEPPAGTAGTPLASAQDLVLAQHAAFAAADRAALAGLVAAGAFAIGLDADELADGRDAVVAQLVRDLGEPPPGGFTIDSRAIAIGEDRGHAWIAEQLEITAPGRAPRSVALGELAAQIDGRWQAIALHWAAPVDDATAQRLAILSKLPVPARIADRIGDRPGDRTDGARELDQAVRAAFASRAELAGAFSERSDAFNIGSGGERVHGGAALRRIFSRLRAEVRLHDGVRVASGAAWDPRQAAAPWIGWAALNVDFTSRTRAHTDVTQTFRVLAIVIREPAGWRIVQTQWSNGGPIR